MTSRRTAAKETRLFAAIICLFVCSFQKASSRSHTANLARAQTRHELKRAPGFRAKRCFEFFEVLCVRFPISLVK